MLMFAAIFVTATLFIGLLYAIYGAGWDSGFKRACAIFDQTMYDMKKEAAEKR